MCPSFQADYFTSYPCDTPKTHGLIVWWIKLGTLVITTHLFKSIEPTTQVSLKGCYVLRCAPGCSTLGSCCILLIKLTLSLGCDIFSIWCLSQFLKLLWICIAFMSASNISSECTVQYFFHYSSWNFLQESCIWVVSGSIFRSEMFNWYVIWEIPCYW